MRIVDWRAKPSKLVVVNPLCGGQIVGLAALEGYPGTLPGPLDGNDDSGWQVWQEGRHFAMYTQNIRNRQFHFQSLDLKWICLSIIVSRTAVKCQPSWCGRNLCLKWNTADFGGWKML